MRKARLLATATALPRILRRHGEVLRTAHSLSSPLFTCCPSMSPCWKEVGPHTVDGVARFSKIPDGLPGIETRMALLFNQTKACQPQEEAKLGLPRFVQLTATNAAKLYGLGGRKGSIAPGYDADLAIWHPAGEGEIEISQGMLHHGVDYTPFEGMHVRNWPRYINTLTNRLRQSPCRIAYGVCK